MATTRPMAPRSCPGLVRATYKPHSITGGIGFDGRQECFGAFEVQKVCIKLQKLDYYGTYHDRTSYVCSAETLGRTASRPPGPATLPG